jgi:co-chaperonin GroES (HSP10)
VIVLGHRVLIKPDAQPAKTDSGLILTEDREFVATSGTVVQVGPGHSKLKYDARQRAIRACLEAIARPHGATNDWFHGGIRVATDRVTALLGTCDPNPDVQVGDRVAFDGDTGLSISVDGEPYLILNHDDVVIIIQEAEEAA